MIAGTERGLLLTCLWYIREVDPVTLLLTGLTRDGVYLVEDGEVVGAVNNFRFNESPLDVLARATEAGAHRAGAVARVGRVDEPHRHAPVAGGGLQHELGEPGDLRPTCQSASRRCDRCDRCASVRSVRSVRSVPCGAVRRPIDATLWRPAGQASAPTT